MENNNEFVSLGAKIEGVDKFQLNDTLIDSLYNKATDGDSSHLNSFKECIGKLVNEVNDLSDECIDIDAWDNGDIDISDHTHQERSALKVIQESVVNGLNNKIGEQLSKTFYLKNELYDTLNYFNLTAGIDIESLKVDMQEAVDNSKPNVNLWETVKLMKEHNNNLTNNNSNT